MDKRALFGQVDAAVENALDNRSSILDTVEVEEWDGVLLEQDAENVNRLIESVCIEYGWTLTDYNKVVRGIYSNRHTP